MNNTFTKRFVSRLFALGLLTTGLGINQASAQVDVTATAGTTTASYTNLSSAFTAINGGTHMGAITIDVSASFTDVANAVLNSSGSGTASYTSVLVRPVNDGITISFATAGGRGVIELNGADNVTIDGDNPNTMGTNRNLTIVNTAAATTTYSSVIRVAAGTAAPYLDNDNISLRNLILNGSATGQNNSGVTSTTGAGNTTFGVIVGPNGGATVTTITSVTGAMASGATANTFIVNNCAINQCARGIAFIGTNAASSTGVTITNNLIGDQATTLVGAPPYTTPASTVYTKGIYVQGTTSLAINGNSIKNILSYIGTTMNAIELNSNIGAAAGTIDINNNTITGVVNNTASNQTAGILVSSANVIYNINNNNISSIQTVGSASTQGINVTSSGPSGLIEKNKISYIYARASGGYAARAIVISGGNNITIQNNMIWDLNAVNNNSTTSNTFAVKGIALMSGTGHKVYYNSVNLYGAMLGASTSADNTTCLIVSTTGQTGCDIRNNIFSNKMTGAANTVHACIQLPSGATSAMNLTLNNNAYYIGSASNSYVGILQATFTGYTAANFSAASTAPATNLRAYTSTLSAAGTNDNASFASTAAAPFMSATDLHINIGAATVTDVDGKGAVIGTVTTDFDGDVRSGSTPDIGADEFLLPVCAGAVGGTTTPSTIGFCVGGSTGFTVTGATAGTGITYQWEVSSTGGGAGFSNVTGGTGANTISYNTGTGLAPGVYYFRLNVTCSTGPVTGYSNEVMLTVNALPTIGVTPPSPSRCSADPATTLTASGAATYTWAPASGLSATTGTSVTASPGATTTYTVTGTDMNGCVNTTNVSLAVNLSPFAPVVSPSTIAICSGGNVALTASATIMGPTSATQGSGSSVSALTSTTATNFPNPFANYYGGNKHQMLILASELTSLGMVNGSVISSIGLQVSVVNVSGVGLLSFLVRGGHTSLSSLSAFQTGLTDLTTAATYTAGPGVNTITFSTPLVWNGVDNIIIETSYSNNNGGTTGGNVSLVYGSTPFASTLVYRADNTAAATMNNYSGTPSFTLSSRPNITFGFTAPVPFTTGTFAWTPATGLSATTGSSVTASPATTTVYSVTSANGSCVSSAGTATVNVGAPLVCGTITAPSGTICSGTNFSLSNNATGSGTLTYAWSDGLGTVYPNSANITANLPAGTHTLSLTVTDGCGANCTTTKMVTIDATPTASISGVSSTACAGDNLNFTGNTDVGTSFSWTGPNTFASTSQNPSIAGSTTAATGTYTFTSTLGSCSSTAATFALTVNPTPTGLSASTSVPAVCEGGSFDLNAVTGPVTSNILVENFNAPLVGWAFTNVSTGTTPANAAWTLRPDAYVPGGAWSGTFHSNDNSQFIFTNSDPLGSGSSTFTTMTSPAMNIAGYTTLALDFYHHYNYYTQPDTAKVQVSLNGTTWTTVQTYTGVDVGAIGGFVTANINLNAYVGNPTLYVRFYYRASWDFGWAIDNFKVSGTAPTNTYAWTSVPAGFTSTDEDPTGVVPTTSTAYTITVTNTYGCSATATTNITVNALPTVVASSDEADNTVCDGDDVVLNGSGADAYTWDNGATDGVALVPTGTTTYTVTGTETATGCSNTDAITIAVNALPVVGASSTAPGDSICAGSNVTLNGSGANSYTWDNGVTDDVPFAATVTTTYVVTGTDVITGCSDTASITIDVNALPVVTASSDDADNTICNGDAVTLNGGGADAYTWDNGATDGVAIAPAATTTYTVTGTETATGCSNTDVITITVNTLDLGTSVSLATITANSATGTYQWINCATMLPIAGETNQSYTATSNGDYAVIVTDNGCSDTTGCVNITGLGVQQMGNAVFALYPNPANEMFTIVSTSDAQVTILDLMGNIIMNGQLNKGENKFTTGQMARGVYVVRIANNNGQLLNTQRVTITK